MKRLAVVLVALVFSIFLADTSLAEWEAGVKITEEGVKGFYIAVGDYFKVPEREIIIIKEKKIKDHEIPVILFLSKRSGLPSAKIVEMRLSGLTWIQITVRLGFTAEIFYVEVKEAKGPPYGRAYGYYKKPRKEWGTIVLSDAEVVDFVNLRFMSEHWGFEPELVIQMRSEGKDFVEINGSLGKKKQPKDKEKGNQNNKGKGKGH